MSYSLFAFILLCSLYWVFVSLLGALLQAAGAVPAARKPLAGTLSHVSQRKSMSLLVSWELGASRPISEP